MGISPDNWFDWSQRPLRLDEAAQRVGYLPGQLVFIQVQLLEIGKITQFGRDRSGQVVGSEDSSDWTGGPAVGYLPGQLVYRYSCSRLERLPSSVGTGPVKSLDLRFR